MLLLALFGVIPVLYSLYLAVTRPEKGAGEAGGGFAGLGNFIQTAGDYRFVPAAEHVAAFLLLWLISLSVLVNGRLIPDNFGADGVVGTQLRAAAWHGDYADPAVADPGPPPSVRTPWRPT